MLKRFAHEKVRFAMVGSFNTCLDFALLNFMIFVLKMPTLIANTFSVGICIFISYFLNHYFVFRQNEKPNMKSLAQFVCITGFSSIILQDMVISGFVAFTHSEFSRSLIIFNGLNGERALEINIAKVAAVIVGMAWNFVLYKYVVFRRDRRSSPIVDVLAGQPLPD